MCRITICLVVLAGAGLPHRAGAVSVVLLAADSRGATDGQWAPPILRDGVFPTLRPPTAPSISCMVSHQLYSESRFAIEFDISSIPADAAVTCVELALTEVVDSLYSTVPLNGYAGNGVISSADMVAGSLLLADISDGVVDVARLDVTGFVASLRASSQNFAGFMCKDTTLYNGGLDYYQVWSKWAEPNPAWPDATLPSLTVEFEPIPEPSTLALLWVAAFGFLVHTRRRRKH